MKTARPSPSSTPASLQGLSSDPASWWQPQPPAAAPSDPQTYASQSLAGINGGPGSPTMDLLNPQWAQFLDRVRGVASQGGKAYGGMSMGGGRKKTAAPATAKPAATPSPWSLG